ncbi:unnamed protein product [Paramecium octaurelia]|uniref:Protein kinase domain-containing protein n=1 Tax=Paramecium octaurelia TaxID=43137 RepID=A0A8S1SR57_PAROT|nr:unnamed protein product [Paramecium octaurelia]
MNYNAQFILFPTLKQYSQTNETITIDGTTYKKFKSPINQGEEGIVYKGQNVQTNEIVAIKECKTIQLKSIQAIQKNNQPHIIRIIGVVKQQNGQLIAVFEFAHGEFQQFMITKNEKNLSDEEKNDCFFQMMGGVDQLHQLGFFHRDVKPENFVYIKGPNNKMTIKLIDFGLVQDNKENITYTNVIGTPYYLAPEVFEDGNSSSNNQTRLLTGDTIFQGISMQDVFDKIQTIEQEDINRQIEDNNKNKAKEKHLMKYMLSLIPSQRISLQEIFNFYEPQQIMEQKEQEQIYVEMKQYKDEELKQKLNEFQFKKQEKMAQMKRDVERIMEEDNLEELKFLLDKLIQEKTNETQRKNQQTKNNQIAQLNDQKRKDIQELTAKKQFLLDQLKYIKCTNKLIFEKFSEKQQILNEINSQDRKKQELLNYINDQIQKYKGIILKTKQRKNFIQQAQTKEELKEYNELTQEYEQYQKNQMIIFEKIVQEQELLEDQSSQLKWNQSRNWKKKNNNINLYQKQLNNNQMNNLLRFIKCNTEFPFIKEHKFKLKLKRRFKIRLNIITKYHKISKLQNFKKKQFSNMNLYSNQLLLINYAIASLKKLSRLKIDSKLRLKSHINACNKLIKNFWINISQNLRSQTKNQLIIRKNIILSKNQKYANQITQIITQIGQAFDCLNNLKQLISQRTLLSYIQYTQLYSQFQKSLKSFEKHHSLLHQQIYNDQQIELKNQERIKALKITKYQLDQFNQKMNQLKDQLTNLIKIEYQNNEKTQNLINTRLTKIDQNTIQQYELYVKFTQFNQLESCDIVQNQIKQLEDFQGKLKEVEANEQEYINQVELIVKNIGEEKKREQEKEILQLNNQLQTRYIEYTKHLQTIKFQIPSVEFQQQMNQNKENLQKELKYEITILNELSQLYYENMDIKQRIQAYFDNFQNVYHQNKQWLENIIKNVTQKSQELNFCFINDNLIKNYEYLKNQEVQFFQVLTSINQKITNQQFNQQQLNEFKEYILKVYNEIDELTKKILVEDEIKVFNKAYQQNLESYEKLYALINYIKQYHLTKYYQRMKQNANNLKAIQQNKEESDYQKLFQSKQIEENEENSKKEKEAQDILLRYENVLLKNYNKIPIDAMQKDKEQIEKQIVEIENQIKYKNLVELRSRISDQTIVRDIINANYLDKIFVLTTLRKYNFEHKI